MLLHLLPGWPPRQVHQLLNRSLLPNWRNGPAWSVSPDPDATGPALQAVFPATAAEADNVDAIFSPQVEPSAAEGPESVTMSSHGFVCAGRGDMFPERGPQAGDEESTFGVSTLNHGALVLQSFNASAISSSASATKALARAALSSASATTASAQAFLNFA